MTTTVYNGISYDLQIAGGVLQTRVTGSGSWNSHPQMVGLQDDVHLVGNWIVGWTGGSYHSTSIEDRSIFYASDYALYSGAVSGLVPIVITNDAGTTPPPSGSGSSATQTTHETQVSMSGHKIVDGAAGTNPTDFIILSQLTANSQALTTVINAGDAAVQTDIDAIKLVVANLPAGLTIAQVQAAIDASVAETVLNEVIDDNQKQALVDAALSQLSTIDTAVIGRVGSTEAILVSLEPRVAALETLTVAHTAALDAGVAKDGTQDQAIAALNTGLAAVVTVNNAQNTRLSNAESAAALVNQAITAVEVQISNGSVVSAMGVPLSAVSIDNSNNEHVTVSIALGSSNAGKRRVSSAYRVFSTGKEEKFHAAEGRDGETYIFTYLKNRDGSSTVNLVLSAGSIGTVSSGGGSTPPAPNFPEIELSGYGLKYRYNPLAFNGTIEQSPIGQNAWVQVANTTDVTNAHISADGTRLYLYSSVNGKYETLLPNADWSTSEDGDYNASRVGGYILV